MSADLFDPLETAELLSAARAAGTSDALLESLGGDLAGKLLGSIQSVIEQANSQCFRFDIRFAMSGDEPRLIEVDPNRSLAGPPAVLGLSAEQSTRKLTGIVVLVSGDEGTGDLEFPGAGKRVLLKEGAGHVWPAFLEARTSGSPLIALGFHAYGPSFQ